MRLRFLGKNSVPGDSPILYATDRYSFVVQGWKVTDPEVLAKLDLPADKTCVEVPAALFVHLAMDGLRGAIAHWAPQMSIPEFEDCVEVTKASIRALLLEKNLGVDHE